MRTSLRYHLEEIGDLVPRTTPIPQPQIIDVRRQRLIPFLRLYFLVRLALGDHSLSIPSPNPPPPSPIMGTHVCNSHFFGLFSVFLLIALPPRFFHPRPLLHPSSQAVNAPSSSFSRVRWYTTRHSHKDSFHNSHNNDTASTMQTIATTVVTQAT